MKYAYRVGIALAICASSMLPAQTAGAAKLPVSVAADRAAAFAQSTCDRDESCVAHGVSNCRRQRVRIVLCRTFLTRDTEAQGRYRCSRLVRLAAIPGTRHAKVSGLGSWHC